MRQLSVSVPSSGCCVPSLPAGSYVIGVHASKHVDFDGYGAVPAWMQFLSTASQNTSHLPPHAPPPKALAFRHSSFELPIRAWARRQPTVFSESPSVP